MKLSENFELEEFTTSQTAARLGIDNTPGDEEKENLKALCVNVLQPLRYRLGKPIMINSGFRCEQLNSIIGGARNSQHAKGEAADIMVPGVVLKTVYQTILDTLEFDQLIYEFDSWIHVSFTTHRKNRMQALVATKEDGKTKYKLFDGFA